MRMPASGPNALPAALMSPAERRAELCRLLALGLVRLLARQSSELSDRDGESSLHSPGDQSAHATASTWRVA